MGFIMVIEGKKGSLIPNPPDDVMGIAVISLAQKFEIRKTLIEAAVFFRGKGPPLCLCPKRKFLSPLGGKPCAQYDDPDKNKDHWNDDDWKIHNITSSIYYHIHDFYILIFVCPEFNLADLKNLFLYGIKNFHILSGEIAVSLIYYLYHSI
jgi:hypothetical protein